MRPEQVTEEHRDPCLAQTDCRYDEAPRQGSVLALENAVLPWNMVDKSTSSPRTYLGPVLDDFAVQGGLHFPE